jgi:hypothetical protein
MRARWIVFWLAFSLTPAMAASERECYDRYRKGGCTGAECDRKNADYNRCIDDLANADKRGSDPNMGPLGGSNTPAYVPPGKLEKIPLNKVR